MFFFLNLLEKEKILFGKGGPTWQPGRHHEDILTPKLNPIRSAFSCSKGKKYNQNFLQEAKINLLRKHSCVFFKTATGTTCLP